MDKDAHHIFEYSTLKVPYEELNQTYRTGHKNIERTAAAIKQSSTALQSHLKKEGNDVVAVEPVAVIFDELSRRVDDFRRAVSRATKDERQIVDIMEKRVDHLAMEEAVPHGELERWHKNRDRTNRLIIGYLLRCGRIETARAFAKKADLEDMVDIDIFAQAHVIEASLLVKDPSACLEWIIQHRSRLRKINSELEQYVKVQVAIEMLREGKQIEAIKYARKFLTNQEKLGKPIEDVLTLWGLLAVNINTSIEKYVKLLDEDRWTALADMFRGEFGNLYQLPSQSPFSVCIQSGLCAFKTPECSPGGNDKCVTCQPSAFALAEGLPHAHTGQSNLRCAFSGEPLNEANPPWMLPTGRVYGERSLDRLTQGDLIRCPRTESWVPRDQCQRLYVL